MSAAAQEPLDRKGARAIEAIDQYTLRAYITSARGRRSIAADVIDMVAEDLRREGAEQATAQLARMTQAARAASLYVPEPERSNFRREYGLDEATS